MSGTETGAAKRILELAGALPEGATLSAKGLLHLGGRAAVDQALSRLARGGALLRVGRGLYARPIVGRFGKRPPEASKLVPALAAQRGETMVRHGAAAANALGLTTQVPVREVYLTSGRTRQLKLGAQRVELRHAPAWQLLMPGKPAGDVLRALAWLGPERASGAVEVLRRALPASEVAALGALRTRMPTWMAQQVSGMLSGG